MGGDWFGIIPEWLTFLLVFAVQVLANAGGVWLGSRHRAEARDRHEAQIGALQAAVFGLLALLVGFTFSMAVTRFEHRKQLVVDEANGIGTALLRTSLLPPPYAEEAAALLRDYTAQRIRFHSQANDPEILRQSMEASHLLQQQLWTRASAASALDPRSVSAGLFVDALNHVIDLEGERTAAFRNHVPVMAFLLIVVTAATGLGFTGYLCGLVGARHAVANAVLAVLIAASVVLIIDLDHPRRGAILVSPQPLLDLQAGFLR